MIKLYVGIKANKVHTNLNDFEGSTTYEYEAEHGPHMSSSWWVLDGDEVRAPNTEELQAREDAADLIRVEGLESQCYTYQISRTGLKCPANFYALLIGAKAAGKLGPKVIDCFVSLDLLWKLYETYKKDSSIEIEFDVAGTLPHSFDEIREEIEA